MPVSPHRPSPGLPPPIVRVSARETHSCQNSLAVRLAVRLWTVLTFSRGPVRVSLFITCYNDTLFPATGQAVVRLLERLGHTVDFPLEQTCCGQMHYNTGYQQEAMPLMRRFVEIF